MREREKVIRILMDRDDLTRLEAIEQIEECKEALLDEQDDSVIEEMLGLEPDYLFGVLNL